MAFRSSASANATSGSISAVPAGVQANDYLGAWLSVDNASATLSAPAGWTGRTTLTWAIGSPDGHRFFYADKDDAVGGGGDSFAFDTVGGGDRSLKTVALTGRDNAAPRSTSPVGTTNTTSNATPISATLTGITASEGDDVLIGWCTDQTASDGRWTSGAITNYTERQDGVAQNWVSGIGIHTRDNVSAGATGNFSVTLTRNSGTGNAGYGAIVIAIKAAAGGAQTVSPGSITSAEAFGTAQLNFELGPAGAVASSEAFGTAQLNFTLVDVGNISSAEAFGAAQLNFTLTDAGNISSAEAFGGASVVQEGGAQTLVADAIASAEAFGTAQFNFTLIDVGAIGSAEAFGGSQLNFTILGEGIGSEEAFGSQSVIPEQFIGATGITSAEAFGTAVVDASNANWRLINAIELDSGRMLKLWLDLNQLQ